MQYVDTMVTRHNPTDVRLLRKSINKKNGEDLNHGNIGSKVNMYDIENEGHQENQTFKGKTDIDDSKSNLVSNTNTG